MISVINPITKAVSNLLTGADLVPEEHVLSLAPVCAGGIVFTRAGNTVYVNGRSAGGLSSSVSTGNYPIAASIPARFRPDKEQSIACSIGPNSHWIKIATDGSVVLVVNTNQSAGSYVYGANGAYCVKNTEAIGRGS